MKVKLAIEFEINIDKNISTVRDIEKEVEIMAHNMAKSVEKDWNVKFTGEHSYVSEKTNNKTEYDNGVFYSYEY